MHGTLHGRPRAPPSHTHPPFFPGPPPGPGRAVPRPRPVRGTRRRCASPRPASARSRHQRPPRPRAPSPRPRSQAITHPAPHAAAPLEPQAQLRKESNRAVRNRLLCHASVFAEHLADVRGAVADDRESGRPANSSDLNFLHVEKCSGFLLDVEGFLVCKNVGPITLDEIGHRREQGEGGRSIHWDDLVQASNVKSPAFRARNRIARPPRSS